MKTIIISFFISAIAITCIEIEITPPKFVKLVKKEFSLIYKKISQVENNLISIELKLDEKLEGGKNGIN